MSELTADTYTAPSGGAIYAGMVAPEPPPVEREEE